MRGEKFVIDEQEERNGQNFGISMAAMEAIPVPSSLQWKGRTFISNIFVLDEFSRQ